MVPSRRRRIENARSLPGPYPVSRGGDGTELSPARSADIDCDGEIAARAVLGYFGSLGQLYFSPA